MSGLSSWAQSPNHAFCTAESESCSSPLAMARLRIGCCMLSANGQGPFASAPGNAARTLPWVAAKISQ